MIVQTNINKGFIEDQLVKKAIANDVMDRIDNLLAVAPEIFSTNKSALGKLYSGDIQIAIKTFVDDMESVTKFYAIEDGGIVFRSERKEGEETKEFSSIFVASGDWPEKFEKLEDSVREAHCAL